MPLGLEITLDYMGIPAVEAWGLFQESHPALLNGDRQVDFYGDIHLAGEMPNAIKQKGKPHFVVKVGDAELDYMPVGGSNLQLGIVEGCADGSNDAWAWAEPFTRSEKFRCARLYDHEYEYWQNAHDPLQYTAVGRSYAGLPMKSNGLPFPLEQQIIDTSQNPGRRVLRDGYVEAVGSVMWLGEPFWSLTGASKQAVLATDWLQCEPLPDGVLRVQAADAPFTTAEGAFGDLQDKLRSLLFPQTQ